MKPENDKYYQVINLLRKSKPVLESTHNIEENVMSKISQVPHTRFFLSKSVDLLFGWVYVGWVRRSLIGASVLLIIIFVYQQGIILKQIDYLSRQTIIIGTETGTKHTDEIDKMLLIYKISGWRFHSQNKINTEKELNKLLESVNELKVKYEDLLNFIEDDPELKRYIENRLLEKNNIRINL
ncbi:MAG TPA: hypothetical protein VMV77_13210 [Bacteroidales bacterium]|nr:hypothetical protein [Bacteroidales bacterium]